MKLFIKEHASFVVLQVVQCAIIVLILWLGGMRHLTNILYAMFLSIFLLGVYLVSRYVTRRNFYKKLEKPSVTLDESLMKTDMVPIAQALDQLLKSQYTLYQNRIGDIQAAKEEHLTFMDRWVHQMKTPLSVIELTAQDLDEPESSSIREETERMKNGLNTVLYMARLRTIEQDFQIKRVSLAALVHEVNQDNKRFFIRNQVYPTLDQKETTITVETDEKWMHFMMTQLIQNAVKYSTGKSKSLALSLYIRKGEAVFEITDFGVGIPKSDQKRIFHAFYTGENGRHFRESTGMGLYLVQEVSHYLGHKLEMESTVGEGTTFRIVFTPEQTMAT